jgi:hypothetical protein
MKNSKSQTELSSRTNVNNTSREKENSYMNNFM